MKTVQIKNLNKSHRTKLFTVKGRIKFLNVCPNKKSNGKHLNSILFDKHSEIEVIAFSNCDDIFKQLNTNNVVQISFASVKEVNKDFKKTKHKYQIILDSKSMIGIINNDEVNIDEFPTHKYTSGSELKTIIPSGLVIDVIGVCVQMYPQSPTNRSGKIKVDSTEIEFRVYGEKANDNELFEVGSTLSMSCVTYGTYNRSVYLSVGPLSSVVKCDPRQLVIDADDKQHIQRFLQLPSTGSPNIQQLGKVKEICQDSMVGSPAQRLSTSSSSALSKENVMLVLSDQRLSTSYSTPSNKNYLVKFPDQNPSTSILSNKNLGIESSDQRLSTLCSTSTNKNLGIESPDQTLSTLCSTSTNKRKTLDFNEEEIASKLPKLTESDETFFGIVMNLIENVENKDAVKMRILEFIQNYIAKDESI